MKGFELIDSLHCTTVYVSDQDKALEFYGGLLGWETVNDVMMGESRWLVVRPQSAVTGIALLGLEWAGPEGSPVTVGGHTGITLTAPDVQGLYDSLSAKGVVFQGPPEEMPWGGEGVHLNDPDGNGYFVAGA
jgi:catechol 2,3-dioxygenase-like lactoylglutathione lyase family enzyme